MTLLLAGTTLTFSVVAGGIVKWVIGRINVGIDAYTAEKMKNIATHQDIEKLIEQAVLH